VPRAPRANPYLSAVTGAPHDADIVRHSAPSRLSRTLVRVRIVWRPAGLDEYPVRHRIAALGESHRRVGELVEADDINVLDLVDEDKLLTEEMLGAA